jgi:ketosteroid isomerase-like protein
MPRSRWGCFACRLDLPEAWVLALQASSWPPHKSARVIRQRVAGATASLMRPAAARDTGRAISQASTEVVRQAFAAWNRGDIEGYIAHLCFDVEAVPMGAALEGKVWRGHDEIRAWAQTHPEVWETLLIWAEEFEQVDEELLLVSGHWDAVGRSGVEMSAPATWVFGFRDGRIGYWQAYTSRAAALEAVGLA